MRVLTCRWRKQFLLLLLVACLLYVFFALFIISKFPKEDLKDSLGWKYLAGSKTYKSKNNNKSRHEHKNKTSMNELKFSPLQGSDESLILRAKTKMSYNVHVFYYPWYANPETDGEYHHWNHPYLPHWNKEEAKKYETGTHIPPDDIGSNFYPELGPYSSRDPQVIHKHMAQMQKAGIGKIRTVSIDFAVNIHVYLLKLIYSQHVSEEVIITCLFIYVFRHC